MPKACTPGNAAAAIVGHVGVTGDPPAQAHLEALRSPHDQLHAMFNGGEAKAYTQFFQDAASSGEKAVVQNGLSHAGAPPDNPGALSPEHKRSGSDVLKMALTETRPVAHILGEEIVGPISNALTDHYVKYAEAMKSDPTAGRAEYNQLIKPLLETIPTEGGSHTRNYTGQLYRDWLKAGGDLYAGKHNTSAWSSIINTAKNNILIGNTNVLFGTAFEVPIKGASVVGPQWFGNMFDAMFIKTGGNPLKIFMRTPDGIKAGIYGMEPTAHDVPFFANDGTPFGNAWKKWVFEPNRALRNRMWGLSDPFSNVGKNIALSAAGGDPALARQIAEVVVFSQRMGNPTVGAMRGPLANMPYQLLSYTIKTTQLYGNALIDLFGKGSTPKQRAAGLQFLATWHVMQAGFSAATNALEGKDPGAGALIGLGQIPLLFDTARWADPNFNEWVKANQGVLGKTFGASGISRLYIVPSIAGGVAGKGIDAMHKAIEAARNDEPTEAVHQAVTGVVKLMPFFNSPLGTIVGQRTWSLMDKYFTGEAQPDQGFTPIINEYRLPDILRVNQ